MSEFTEALSRGLARTGYDNRAAQRVEFRDGRYYRPPGYPSGAEMKGVRGDGQEYPDGTWLTLERSGATGWFVVGIDSHAASGSMLA